MNKYEQLIEYVVNESNEAKAAELFHEIVVEKSRDIYESLMDSEDEFGGDQADELINDISSDETGMREDDDDDMGGEEGFGGDEAPEFGGEEGMGDEYGAESEEGEASIEDRVVDLEDSLDALMAEFDSIMGDEEGMGGDEMGGEDMGDMGDDMEPGDEFGSEEEEIDMEGRFNEAVSLTKVTKGISNSTEAEGTNKRSINADNSGKKGAVAKPHTPTGTEAKGQSNPTVKPGDGTTEPRQSKVSEPKKKGEDGAINKKSLSGS